MKSHYDIKLEIARFLEESGISSYDLMRIGKELCSCGTCADFVQHYSKDGKEIDFGHCKRGNVDKSKRPGSAVCGFWSLRGEDDG